MENITLNVGLATLCCCGHDLSMGEGNKVFKTYDDENQIERYPSKRKM